MLQEIFKFYIINTKNIVNMLLFNTFSLHQYIRYKAIKHLPLKYFSI